VLSVRRIGSAAAAGRTYLTVLLGEGRTGNALVNRAQQTPQCASRLSRTISAIETVRSKGPYFELVFSIQGMSAKLHGVPHGHTLGLKLEQAVAGLLRGQRFGCIAAVFETVRHPHLGTNGLFLLCDGVIGETRQGNNVLCWYVILIRLSSFPFRTYCSFTRPFLCFPFSPSGTHLFILPQTKSW
jgi:hypothetical protein